MKGASIAAALALALAAWGAAAQGYPTKVVRMVVPASAGGAFDILARAATPAMAAAFGQPVIVENRATVSGLGGVEYVAKAAPDGYTLSVAGVSQLVYPKHFYAKLPYDPERDFAGIGMIAEFPYALFVQSPVPVRDLQQFLAYVKANPGKLNYGTSGVGQTFHLAMEMLRFRAGIELTHVPYKGMANVLTDFAGGRIEAVFYPPSAQVMALVKEGKVRPVVTAGDRRLPALPDVPTFAEQGLANFEVVGWLGLLAPAKTPPGIVARLNQELNRALNSPEASKAYTQLSSTQVTSTPAEIETRVSREIAAWGPVIRKLGIQLE